MAYGITDQGFVRKTQENIISDLETEWKNKFGQDSDLSEDSPNSIIIGLVSDMADELWNAAEDSYNALNPTTATGVPLANDANLVGITPKEASPSTASVSFRGDNTTLIPAGTQVKQSATNLVFKTIEAGQISQGFCNWVQFQISQLVNSVSYILYIDGNSYSYTSDSSATYDEIVLGLKAVVEGAALGLTITNEGSGLLTIEATDKDDIYDISTGSKFTIGKVQSVIEVENLTLGEISITPESIDTISTAVSGLDSVLNYYDGNTGREAESDQELRIRRKVDIVVAGFSFTDAIKARLSNVNGVSYAKVYENDELYTVNDIPAKSFESVVVGGSNQEIANELYTAKIGGIKSWGAESAVVRDSDNIPHYIRFTRPSNLYFWVKITINSYDSESDFPINGEAAIKQSILDFGQALNIGENVILQKFYKPVYEIDGIAAATIQIASTPSPTDVPVYGSANINCSIRQIPNFDLTRIAVVL